MTLRRLALPLLFTSSSLLISACMCNDDKKAPDVEEGAKTEKKKKKAVRKGRDPKAELTAVAMAAVIDGKAYMWADGRTGTIAIDQTRVKWDGEGFEYSGQGGFNRMSTGGDSWWSTQGNAEAKALDTFAATNSTAPEGYKLLTDVARNGLYKISLSGAQGQRVRMGMFKQAPEAVYWFSGKSPDNSRAAPALTADKVWTEADGSRKAGPPAGSTAVAAVAPSAADVAKWTADLGKRRGADFVAGWTGSQDVDNDGTAEGLICGSGGKDAGNCYVVDTDGYHPVNLPWLAGKADPQGFTVGTANYIIWQGPAARAKEGAPDVAHLLRYTGGAYIVDNLS